ncbi:50S ribosomal protein L22 [Candidatus Curtissbacteria bacterium]|nr:50S ribosomal protein L22 [Candidatus Curtissbacteria bacterium]
MIVQAKAKNIRVSPQKAKLVVDQIKKMKPHGALDILTYTPKKTAPLLGKVIASAIANAKANHNLEEKSLVFKEILIGKGITFKRFRAGSRGRARPILRRTTNLTVVLEGSEQKTDKVQKAKEENGTKS